MEITINHNWFPRASKRVPSWRLRGLFRFKVEKGSSAMIWHARPQVWYIVGSKWCHTAPGVQPGCLYLSENIDMRPRVISPFTIFRFPSNFYCWWIGVCCFFCIDAFVWTQKFFVISFFCPFDINKDESSSLFAKFVVHFLIPKFQKICQVWEWGKQQHMTKSEILVRFF